MKTTIVCMLCAAALSLSANVNAQEAAPMPSPVVPANMTLSVSVGGEATMVLPGGGNWILASQPAADCPVEVSIGIDVAKDKKTGAEIPGASSETFVTFKGKQEGKTVVQLNCVNAAGVVINSRAVAIEVVK